MEFYEYPEKVIEDQTVTLVARVDSEILAKKHSETGSLWAEYVYYEEVSGMDGTSSYGATGVTKAAEVIPLHLWTIDHRSESVIHAIHYIAFGEGVTGKLREYIDNTQNSIENLSRLNHTLQKDIQEVARQLSEVRLSEFALKKELKEIKLLQNRTTLRLEGLDNRIFKLYKSFWKRLKFLFTRRF